MLDWLIKNPQAIIFAIFGVIALLGRAAQAQKEAKAKRERAMRNGRPPHTATPPPLDTSRTDAGEAERTRRVQEEIRRKILARMERANAPASMPRPASTPVSRNARQPVTMPPPLPPARAEQPQTAFPADESTNAYQSAMQQLAEMQALTASANAHKDESFAVHATDAAIAARARNDDLLASLHNISELRRALLLREILDKPMSLR